MDERTRSLKTLTTVIYALYAASFVVGISAIVAIVVNYVKKDDVTGTLFESHFRWQIRTFWFALLWSVIGVITFIVVIGWFILFADAVWVIYRLVKGWLNLHDNRPMYAAPTQAANNPAPAAAAAAPTIDATLPFAPVADAKLVCIVGTLQGMSFRIGDGVVIGRSQEADVVVPDSQVSNRHAWVGPVDGRLVVRDLGSTNGTYLNDDLANPVQEAELREGDLVVLGKHDQMKFRVSFS